MTARGGAAEKSGLKTNGAESVRAAKDKELEPWCNDPNSDSIPQLTPTKN